MSEYPGPGGWTGQPGALDPPTVTTGDVLLGLLALSQMPDPTLSDLQAALGELTPTNQLMLMTGAARLVRVLIADAAESGGRPVEEVVAMYRRAFLVVRDEHEGGC